MTVDPHHRDGGRLQDDLLQDLRDAAPVPAPPATAPPGTAPPATAPRTPAPPPPPPPSAAAMELRVQPGRWIRPSAGMSPDRTALVLGVGWLQVRFCLPGR
jgi:hypothetical protein